MNRQRFVPTPEYRKFIASLRLARQEANCSQRELARRLAWHHSRVVRSEEGMRALTIIEVRAICEALHISVVEFTKQLDECLSAMDAEAKNSTNVAASASADNTSTASTIPPSSPS